MEIALLNAINGNANLYCGVYNLEIQITMAQEALTDERMICFLCVIFGKRAELETSDNVHWILSISNKFLF